MGEIAERGELKQKARPNVPAGPSAQGDDYFLDALFVVLLLAAFLAGAFFAALFTVFRLAGAFFAAFLALGFALFVAIAPPPLAELCKMYTVFARNARPRRVFFRRAPRQSSSTIPRA